MKHLKKFNESRDSDIMDTYIGKPLIVTRRGHSIDCKIFTDQNIGGYGLGIGGDYFDSYDFERALTEGGDGLGRRLFKLSEIDRLSKFLGIDGTKDEIIKEIIHRINRTRNSYVSWNPERDKNSGVYVDMDPESFIDLIETTEYEDWFDANENKYNPQIVHDRRDHIQTLKDICQDLLDDGYIIRIYEHGFNGIKILVGAYKDTTTDSKSWIETVKRIELFAKEIGYNFKGVSCSGAYSEIVIESPID